jgi:hypothetical protein
MGWYVRSRFKIGRHTRLYYSRSLHHRRKHHRKSTAQYSSRRASIQPPDPAVEWEKNNRALLVRQRVNRAMLLYLCGWVPGVIANWRLRKQFKEERAATGITPPFSARVAFQFWVLTVFVGLFVVLPSVLSLL